MLCLFTVSSSFTLIPQDATHLHMYTHMHSGVSRSGINELLRTLSRGGSNFYACLCCSHITPPPTFPSPAPPSSTPTNTLWDMREWALIGCYGILAALLCSNIIRKMVEYCTDIAPDILDCQKTKLPFGLDAEKTHLPKLLVIKDINLPHIF